MRRYIVLGMVFCLWGLAEVPAQTEMDRIGGKAKSTQNVDYVSSKKAILVPGSIQKIVSGKKTLVIEYEKMHKTGKFPIVRIQDIPFKLRKSGKNLEFTWQKVGYELVWLSKGDKVSLASSEAFNRKSFSVKNKNIKNTVISKGLTVETKRSDGVVSILKVVDIVKDSSGKMKKFSVKTYGDKNNPNEFHSENNIMAPEYYKQYEKGINDEVLYIFTSNENGQIFVYYR
ncbi:MAG: hypothetical protein GY866_02430 [Proteobacteria bacterium]|nr:hypothetical protein [Pseudomonadota bacterium]